MIFFKFTLIYSAKLGFMFGDIFNVKCFNLFLIFPTHKLFLPLYVFMSDYQSGHCRSVKGQIMNFRATIEKLDVDLLVEIKQ